MKIMKKTRKIGSKVITLFFFFSVFLHSALAQGDPDTFDTLSNFKQDVAKIEAYEPSLLFSSSYTQDDLNFLNKGEMPKTWFEEFENEDISLSEKPSISTEKEGSKWLIEDNNRHYFVSKKDDELDIYDAQQMKRSETGSGIIIGFSNKTLYILTALHVVKNSRNIKISFYGVLPGKFFDGKIFEQCSEDLDVAVITVDLGEKESAFKALRKFTIDDVPIKKGDSIWVIGHPNNYQWELSPDNNIITRLREDNKDSLFCFTRNGINRGNSGGPVLNAKGHLIGMITKVNENDYGVAVRIETVIGLLRDEWGGISTTNIATKSDEKPINIENQLESYQACGGNSNFIFVEGSKEKKINSFYISQNEVTFDEYDFYCKTKEPYGLNRGAYPVFNVSYSDAEAYCSWLSMKSKGQYRYRLPTGLEWTYVANISGTIYPWGNSSSEEEAKKYAIFFKNSERKPHFVKSLSPTGIGYFEQKDEGIYDLAGNLWEWVSAPVDIKAEELPKDMRYIKGGSFKSAIDDLKCDSFSKNPNEPSEDIGFRIVLEDFNGSKTGLKGLKGVNDED